MKNTQHFTPNDFAHDVVATTLSPIITGKTNEQILSIRVVDPSVGDGQIIIEVIKYIANRLIQNDPNIQVEHAIEMVVSCCVYGVDIDHVVVKKTIDRILRLKKNDHIERAISEHFKCSDALIEFDWSQWPKFDSVIGNPPFLGGSKISGAFGTEYLKKLKRKYPGSGGTTDLSAYFFRLAHGITKTYATIGFIATNTISQGDTRKTGLQWLLNNGCTIYNATRSRPWPGAAAVTISIVHLAKGRSAQIESLEVLLDEKPASDINSRLNPKPERKDPKRLGSNESKSFLGSKIYGQGFLLSPEEREELIAADRKNGERIFPYIGGKEVNTSPTQDFHRYVINFGQMSLEEASNWPDLVRIIREKVKPERDKLPPKNPWNRDVTKRWWQFRAERVGLKRAIQDLPRCLVTAQVTKHLCFSFQPADRIFSQKLFAFPFDDYAHFALLQSRIHEAWTWLLSSTMKTDLNYSATDCFENFPFPEASRLNERSRLERVGRRVYEARSRFMVETDQGLTKTYNALKDPECRDPRVERLRELHWEMDREVLAAYGWEDISAPAYGVTCEKFNDEIINRLFDLNSIRHREENKLDIDPEHNRCQLSMNFNG